MDVKALFEELKCNTIKDKDVKKLLVYLSQNVFLVEQANGYFINIILNLNWYERNEQVVMSYCELILHLVTASTNNVKPTLKMIVKQFNTLSPEEVPANEMESVNSFQKIHSLLQRITELVPSLPSQLIPLLASKFPYLKIDIRTQENYVQNLLKVTSYLPTYRKVILELIISKLIQLDVHCPKMEIQDAEDDEDEIFIMDTDNPVVDQEMKHPLAKILDGLLNRVYLFIDEVCKKNDALDWEATKSLYKDLLSAFDSIILPTYACSHVQFILFYICSLRRPLFEGFIDYLWKKVQNPNVAPILRQACTCYIGSILCRAKYIGIDLVKDCLQLMCQWLHQYLDNQSESSQSYANYHVTFYSVCQTVFYVFAFRHKELIGMKNGLSIMRNLNLDRIVSCSLNPLKICLPSVVTNFASVARNYQIAYCFTIIERNNRMTLPVANETVSLATCLSTFTTLETYYPFDPYCLKRSRKKIEPLYRVYVSVEKEVPKVTEEEDEIFQEIFKNITPSSTQSSFDYGASPGFIELSMRSH